MTTKVYVELLKQLRNLCENLVASSRTISQFLRVFVTTSAGDSPTLNTAHFHHLVHTRLNVLNSISLNWTVSTGDAI